MILLDVFQSNFKIVLWLFVCCFVNRVSKKMPKVILKQNLSYQLSYLVNVLRDFVLSKFLRMVIFYGSFFFLYNHHEVSHFRLVLFKKLCQFWKSGLDTRQCTLSYNVNTVNMSIKGFGRYLYNGHLTIALASLSGYTN